MFRALAIAATLSVAALPAAAADIAASVKVNINGLDAKSAHTKILHAAEAACNAVLRDSAVARYYEMTPCVSDAVAAAEAKYAASGQHFASVENTGH
jgi:UrcA family protein